MRLQCLLPFFLLASVAWSQEHLRYVRPITVADPSGQAYIVLDESLLTHMKPDMGDIRLYSSTGREVQYAMRTQRGGQYSAWSAAKLVNKGMVNGETQFILDIAEPEYDRIQLQLDAHDFVARATVEGADDLTSSAWNNLGTYSLYDFAREKLGSNDAIRLQSPSRYRFLRIRISTGVAPDEVAGAKIANLQEDKAQYVTLSAQPRIVQQGNRTVVTWDTSEKIPVGRIAIEVEPGEVNFSRNATLYCDGRQISNADLSRVRLVRKGRAVESESLALDPYGLRCKSYKLEIFNGDNPPLRISAVKPMMLERRLYFDPQGGSAFNLYYGDEKTPAPQYDYARFFEPEDPDKVLRAELRAEAVNPSFKPWPDERPFSERYPALIWVAMLIAVGLLGAWALKGFKS